MQPIEHYAILRLIFIYVSVLFFCCQAFDRADASCLLFLDFLVIPIADGVLSTDVGVCIAESEQHAALPCILPDNCSERTSINHAQHRIRRYLRLSVSIVPHGASGPPASKRAKILGRVPPVPAARSRAAG